MIKKSLVILVALIALSCGEKKEKDNSTVQVETAELKKEIDSLETVNKEIKSTEESIDESIDKIDEMLNEIEE